MRGRRTVEAGLRIVDGEFPRWVGQSNGVAPVARKRCVLVAQLDDASVPLGAFLGGPAGADGLGGLQNFFRAASHYLALLIYSARRNIGCR